MSIRSAFIFALAVLAIAAGYVLVISYWSYSSGERAGWVQKFSRKGWICKTWEGEMAMVTLPGTVAEKFLFTVRDDEQDQRGSHDVVGPDHPELVAHEDLQGVRLGRPAGQDSGIR